jgi:hypothetical protein
VARFTLGRALPRLAVATLQLAIDAIAGGDTTGPAATLERVEPEPLDNAVATVAGCIGVSPGLLDDWLTGAELQAPKHLGQHVGLPAGHWTGNLPQQTFSCSPGRARLPLARHTHRQARRPERPLRQRPGFTQRQPEYGRPSPTRPSLSCLHNGALNMTTISVTVLDDARNCRLKIDPCMCDVQSSVVVLAGTQATNNEPKLVNIQLLTTDQLSVAVDTSVTQNIGTRSNGVTAAPSSLGKE